MESLTDQKAKADVLFDRIHSRYDLLNHLMSAGLDRRWRRRLVRLFKQRCMDRGQGATVLDIATGTGDLALLLSRTIPGLRITGSDISSKMLERARRKFDRIPQATIQLIEADAMQLPFDSESFDAVTVAFGIRNVPDPAKAFSEIRRVLKPGGCFYMLEFGQSQSRLIAGFMRIYFRTVIPFLGSRVAGDRQAYHYLTRTIESFPCGEVMAGIIGEAGLHTRVAAIMAGGIVYLYEGVKKG